MDHLSTMDMVRIIDIMTEVIIRNEVAFCELDSVAGDGDLGMSLAKGFKELGKARAELPITNIGVFLMACSRVITEHCGGVSGPIWGAAFRSAGKAANGMTELDVAGLGLVIQAAIAGIQARGGAKQGDKTLLDALIPAAEAFKGAATTTNSIKAALTVAAAAAVDGAERTKLIAATKGRASYVGDRSLTHPDAGAAALGIIFTEIAQQF